MRFSILMFASLAVSAVPAVAQSGGSLTWPPAVGAKARILSPVLGPDKQVGIIEGILSDTLQFRGGQGVSRLAPSEIAMIEIPTGTHTEKAKWISIGFLAGAVAGGVIGAATYSHSCSTTTQCNVDTGLDPLARGAATLGGGLLGALSGGLLGAWWGSRPRVTWASMAVPPR